MLRRHIIVIALAATLTIIGGVYLYITWPWVAGRLVPDQEDAAAIAGLAAAPPTSDAVVGEDWPQWRGPNRDGRAPTGPLRTDWTGRPPQRLWSVPLGGGYSSCAVVGNRLYTQDYADGEEGVVCFDAASGQRLWRYSYPADYRGTDSSYAIGPRATPTLHQGRIYTVGAAGKVLCLQEVDGQPQRLWERDLQEFGASIPRWGWACSPLIEGDMVIVQPGGRNAAVAALDRDRGTTLWTAGNDSAGYSSPVAATIAGRRWIFAFTGRSLLLLQPDGTIADRFSWPTQYEVNAATPLVVDQYVFISSDYGQGCALLRVEASGDGGRLVPVYVRRGRGLQNHHSSSVYRNGYLYGFDGNQPAFLRCVRFADGQPLPDWDAGREVDKGSLILAGEHLLIQTERGDLCLVAATPDSFQLLGKLQGVLSGNNNWATPTLVRGRLYLRDERQLSCWAVD